MRKSAIKQIAIKRSSVSAVYYILYTIRHTLFTIRYSLFAICYLLFAISFIFGADVLQEITVREGDTLWSVANFYLKNPHRWPDILSHNPQLSRDPNVILPGMRIKVPVLLIKEHLRAAHLIYILEDVRYRRRREAEWRRAHLNMELFEEDGIRTLEKSRAHVRFPSGELLRLSENSLLIVRPEKPREEAELIAGGVRSSRTKIITAETTVAPVITKLTDAPDFKTRIKEDKTTLVEVYRGAVDVTAQGKSVTVREGFGTEIKFKQAPSSPVKLPEAPDLALGEEATKIIASRDGRFEFNIAPPETAQRDLTTAKDQAQERRPGARILDRTITKYRMQISSSPAFAKIIYEEVRELKDRVNIDARAKQLEDGVYFWRVSYLDELGFEGRFSQPRSFSVDTRPPVLNLYLPQDGAEYDGEFVHIEGTTEPGVRITVNEVDVKVEGSGNFLHALLVKGRDGVIPIRVTATDMAGNISNAERTVIKVRTGTARKTAQPDRTARTDRKERGPAISWAVAAVTISVILGVIMIVAGI